MPRTAIIETATGAILVLDPPVTAEGIAILPEGIDTRAVELSDTEAAKLSQVASAFTVDAAGVVTVVPLTVEQVTNIQLEEAHQAETAASHTDLTNQVEIALNRLTDIATNGGTYTAVQVRDAVVDLARIQRRVLRYLVVRVDDGG